MLLVAIQNTEILQSDFVIGMDPTLCLRFVSYDMRFVNTFIIAKYGVMNYLLLFMQN